MVENSREIVEPSPLKETYPAIGENKLLCIGAFRYGSSLTNFIPYRKSDFHPYVIDICKKRFDSSFLMSLAKWLGFGMLFRNLSRTYYPVTFKKLIPSYHIVTLNKVRLRSSVSLYSIKIKTSRLLYLNRKILYMSLH